MANDVGLPKKWVALKIRLSSSLKRQLDERAFRKGISEGAMLGEVLRYYFEHEPEVQSDQIPDGRITDIAQWRRLYGSRRD